MTERHTSVNMKVSRSRIIFLAAVICIVVAIIFQIVGVSSPGWVRFDSELGDFNDGVIGLWKACNDRGCMDIPFVPAWLGAVRAFGILAILACTTCLAFMVTSFFVKQFKIIVLLPPISAIIAAFLELLEVAIFGGMTGDRIETSSKHSFSYCLPLTVVALILSVVASVLFVVGEKMDSSSKGERSGTTAACPTTKTTGGRPSALFVVGEKRDGSSRMERNAAGSTTTKAKGGLSLRIFRLKTTLTSMVQDSSSTTERHTSVKMKVTRSRLIFLAALICIVVAIIFQIVGVSSTGWVKFDSELGDFNDGMIGLWKACNDRGCMDIPLVPAWLGAVRAFGILAILASITCLATMVTSFFVKQFKIIVLLTPIAAIIAAFLELLEVAIFGGITGDRIETSSKHSFSYCLPLTVVALILSVVASVLFVVGEKMDGSFDCEKRERSAASATTTTRGGLSSRIFRLKMTITSMVRGKI